MPIIVANRRTGRAALLKRYPDLIIIDTTSKALLPYKKLSPFYPHGDIPIPFSPGQYADSVEGIWQGLKVFTDSDIDASKFYIKSMVGIKRSSKTCGSIIGHRKGINGSEILDYISAKQEIYIPSYYWVIEHKLQREMDELFSLSLNHTIALLDYNTSPDLLDPTKPISHATLCKKYLENSNS
jgi:hypothetical protein